MRRTILLFLFAAAAFSQQRAKVDLPPPFHSPSVRNQPQVIDRPAGAQLKLPAGFAIEEYASGFERPRFMVQGPGGEILISDTVKGGAVYAMVDKNKDFKADAERKTLISGLDRPYGVALWNEYVYVAEPESIKRYKYDSKAMTVGAGEEVVAYKGMGGGHNTRTILFSRNGAKMYVTVGSASNVSAGEPPVRAAINEYNPDGSGHAFYAQGTRNPVGLRWYPNTDTMWTTVQERDELGDDLVPDYFTSLQRGGFYGWPFAYFGPNEDPRRKGEKPDLVAKTIRPDISLGAHTAALDFIFYTGQQFPAEYRNGAFIALHGSWNRSKRIGYSLVHVPFQNGKPSGQPKDFLTGWMLSPDQREVWGRPVGLLQLPDGSLLLSDDGGKKVWRISYKR